MFTSMDFTGGAVAAGALLALSILLLLAATTLVQKLSIQKLSIQKLSVQKAKELKPYSIIQPCTRLSWLSSKSTGRASTSTATVPTLVFTRAAASALPEDISKCPRVSCIAKEWCSNYFRTTMHFSSNNAYTTLGFGLTDVPPATRLGVLFVGRQSYIDEIARHLELWSGLSLERGLIIRQRKTLSDKGQSCKGCKYGHCVKGRLLFRDPGQSRPRPNHRDSTKSSGI